MVWTSRSNLTLVNITSRFRGISGSDLFFESKRGRRKLIKSCVNSDNTWAKKTEIVFCCGLCQSVNFVVGFVARSGERVLKRKRTR